ncbi:MAG: TIR domain-containing protein [Pseudonocardiaceae bacterium]
MTAPRVFLSYTRTDGVVVRAFADELQTRGFVVSLDVEFLQPGERWEDAILAHVLAADAFVFFASPASVRSTWVTQELTAFIDHSDRPVVPVLLGDVSFTDLPAPLARYQGIVVDDLADHAQIAAAAGTVAAALDRLVTDIPRQAGPTDDAQRLASDIAENLRRPPDTVIPADHVFLVHGHDLGFRDEVERFLADLGLQSVVLAKAEREERSILDRFESLAVQAGFAVVLLSPDDYGTAVRQFKAPRGGQNALRYRARQNVVLELGFFYGRLGWERVLVIEKAPPEDWPEFERPSDLAGVVFVRSGGDRDWRSELRSKLAKAGMLG